MHIQPAICLLIYWLLDNDCRIVSDNLDLVSQELVKLAKAKGSGDNITVVVVFLKPLEDLVRESGGHAHLAQEPPEIQDEVDTYPPTNDPHLYEGTIHTSLFFQHNKIQFLISSFFKHH